MFYSYLPTFFSNFILCSSLAFSPPNFPRRRQPPCRRSPPSLPSNHRTAFDRNILRHSPVYPCGPAFLLPFPTACARVLSLSSPPFSGSLRLSGRRLGDRAASPVYPCGLALSCPVPPGVFSLCVSRGDGWTTAPPPRPPYDRCLVSIAVPCLLPALHWRRALPGTPPPPSSSTSCAKPSTQTLS